MKKINLKIYGLLLSVVAFIFVGCGYKVGYTFSGASIPPEAKTFSVAYINNNATMVAPILSSEMTDALKEIFLRRSNLSEVTEAGDFAFEGEITNYTSTTASVASSSTSSSNDYGALNSLTITVRIRFNNMLDEKSSFDRSFSAFSDYDSSQLLTEVESELITTIVAELVDEIFQASASNW